MHIGQETQAVLDAVGDIACLIDRSGTIVAVNKLWRDFARNNGAAPETVGPGAPYISPSGALTAPEGEDEVRVGILSLFDGGATFQTDYPCHNASTKRWFRLIATPVATDPPMALLCHRDITAARFNTERIASFDLREHMAALVATSSDAILSFDLGGKLTTWNTAAEALYGYRQDEVLGRSLEIIYPPDWPKSVAAYIDEIIEGRVSTFRAKRCHKDGREIEVEISAAPIVRDGAIIGISNVHRALLHERSSDLRQDMVNRELNHRLKNLFSVVSSVARQTARQARDVKDFQGRLSSRLDGLALSNDILINADRESVTLNDLVTAYIDTFAGERGGNVHVGGPDVWLRQSDLRALGMALHELCTNSIKFGALSRPEGRLEIVWEDAEQDGTRGTRLSWTERGLSGVTPPERDGFGHQVLTMLTPHSVSGRAKLEFEPEGVRWTLFMPLA